jgi:hypothetical protein
MRHCQFEDIVVSDDASGPEHFNKIRELQSTYNFRTITTAVNRGLGNNLNKGQDAVLTPYTLYVQEDFEPTESFAEHLKDALDIMNSYPQWDIIRFYAYLKYPYLKPFAKGYSEMVFKLRYLDYLKIFCYSDHPHLRRSNFLEKFGRYREGNKHRRTEYWMCISFIHHKGKGLFYEEFKSLFHHNNTDEEPRTWENNWMQESRNFFVRLARDNYRRIRYNLDILLYK